MVQAYIFRCIGFELSTIRITCIRREKRVSPSDSDEFGRAWWYSRWPPFGWMDENQDWHKGVCFVEQGCLCWLCSSPQLPHNDRRQLVYLRRSTNLLVLESTAVPTFSFWACSWVSTPSQATMPLLIWYYSINSVLFNWWMNNFIHATNRHYM